MLLRVAGWVLLKGAIVLLKGTKKGAFSFETRPNAVMTEGFPILDKGEKIDGVSMGHRYRFADTSLNPNKGKAARRESEMCVCVCGKTLYAQFARSQH